MRKNFRKAAVSTICMLVVAIMSLTGATYAWFTAGDAGTVTGMQMNVSTADGGIEVSEDGTTYATLLDIGLNTAALMPVSTVDAVNFFDVAFNSANTNEIKAVAGDTKNVIIQKLYLRNTGMEEVTVDLTDTVLSAVTENVINANSNILAATRMAILDADNQMIVGIYAPQSESAYNAIAKPSNGYFEIYGASDEAGVTEATNVVGLTDISFKLPGMTDATTYNPVQITVVVWVEGQDTDANNENAGGSVDIKLNFKKVVPTSAD